MKWTHKLFSLALALLVPALCCAEKAVIVSKNNANDTVSAGDISKIYLAKVNTFPSGGEVVPVSHPEDSAIYKEFISAVIGKTIDQYKAYWAKVIFTGKGQPPKEVAGGDVAMVKLIADNPALIGYVDAAAVNDSVKVLMTF